MKMKKPILKIIQIWTLFLFVTISFLWLISFSSPEISSFWTVKKIDITFVNSVFADDDENEDDYKEYSSKKEKRKKYSENDDEDDNEDDENDHDKKKSTNNPIILPPPADSTVNPIINSGSTTNNVCKTITETIYDTVTSASWIQSQVPKKVSREVCNTVTLEKPIQNDTTVSIKTSPIIEKKTIEEIPPVLVEEKPIITKPISKVKTKISLYTAPNKKIYKIINDGKKVTIQKADGSFTKQSFTSYFEAVAYLNKNAVLPPKVIAKKIPVKKTIPKKTVVSTPTPVKKITPIPVVKAPVVDTTTKAS